ncbi:Ribosome maturation factor RimP [Legionella geestiana]|uniref:Ribosome maturation factor RimP n=1 Tax=Legionella geestiana TaxID=45065 RepID=A0A0W0U8G8_9GAMM|nr:ribosome maturation factor RimP [Legionella geestiana]KTD04081.1 Ribosome maturation factor RimP [Legionella geestiana]QBS12093.1 ribosome maturation factor RimP [Legionella geestiana]QDQ40299.1 ribosome maturation factor RimP [Legionella geestiana]STX53184.1 NusA-like protein [Legionella geestiana]
MIQDKVEQLISPAIADMGYELWGCEYLSQGRHSLLRIYIDREGGITIDDCERVSRQVGALLDVEDPITGEYTLEVSSPGIPRPLLNWKHFSRYIGQEAQLKLHKPWCGKRNITGIIRSADPDAVLLSVDDTEQAFPVSTIVKAYLTVLRGAE